MKIISRIFLTFLSFLVLGIFTNTIFAQNISGTINQYTNVTNISNNGVTVGNANGFNAGDKVLLIQMKGAAITTGNIASFGSITNYNSAGKFEFLIVSAKNGNSLTFSNSICNSYNTSGLVQLVRVPVYGNATITGNITGIPWNGTLGGVIALEANSLTFNANIVASGIGFRGGTATTGFFACGDPNFANGLTNAGRKGEGIATAPTGQEANRAPLANGGGGSNSGNPGAGGGGNGGSGGRGGSEFSGSCAPNFSYGIGGSGLNFTGWRAFLGGGGGGGYRDNGLNATNGSDGGGIVFIICPTINGNNFSVFANGMDVNASSDSEGAGGGGAGGTVYLTSATVNSNLNINVTGGHGGNIFSTLWSSACHGPGGGGGGGAIVFGNPSVPANVNTIISGGSPGTILHTGTPCSGTPHNASSGQNGQLLFNYQIPSSGTPPDLGPDLTVCTGENVLITSSSTYPSYLWSDGSTNSSLTVSNPGYYWLEVSAGCGLIRDSIFIGNFSTNFSLGPDIEICPNSSATLSVGNTFSNPIWSNGAVSPSIQINQTDTISVIVTDQNNCLIQDTVVISVFTIPESIVSAEICAGETYSFNNNSYNQSGIYTLNLIASNGCDSLSTLVLDVHPLPIVTMSDTSICIGEELVLQPSGALSYTWSPSVPLNANGNALVSPQQSTMYTVTGIDVNNCTSTPIQCYVTVYPEPLASFSYYPINPTTTNSFITLTNSSIGGYEFTWSIGNDVFINNNDEIPYPLPSEEGDYEVILTAYSGEGCVSQAFGIISILNDFAFYIPNSFTPDGNEFNNEFKPIFSANQSLYYYHISIFNRWGEEVFESFDPNIGWDGSFRAEICKEGTYSYKIEFTENLDQTKEFTGHLNLLR
jgi:gliding motility-associated-like protein